MQIIDCEQGTEEWFQARLGIPTASMFKDMMAGGEGKTRRTYMLKLAGERITGEISDQFSNSHTERGNQLEPEACNLYEIETGNEVTKCGFMRKEVYVDMYAGYSPDGLVGDAGLIEIKTKLPHLQLDVLLSNKNPTEHMKQIQGGLYISGREWCDYISYWPGLPLFIKRIDRDDDLIEKIRMSIIKFNEELNEIVEKIGAM